MNIKNDPSVVDLMKCAVGMLGSPQEFANYLKLMKEQNSKNFEKIEFTIDSNTYTILGYLSEEQTAKRIKEQELQEFAILKDEFDPDLVEFDVDETGNVSKKPMSWLKKLFKGKISG